MVIIALSIPEIHVSDYRLCLIFDCLLYITINPSHIHPLNLDRRIALLWLATPTLHNVSRYRCSDGLYSLILILDEYEGENVMILVKNSSLDQNVESMPPMPSIQSTMGAHWSVSVG